MEQDVWNSREAIKKNLLKPPVKQAEMKQISNSTILIEPSGADSELELNKVVNKNLIPGSRAALKKK